MMIASFSPADTYLYSMQINCSFYIELWLNKCVGNTHYHDWGFLASCYCRLYLISSGDDNYSLHRCMSHVMLKNLGRLWIAYTEAQVRFYMLEFIMLTLGILHSVTHFHCNSDGKSISHVNGRCALFTVKLHFFECLEVFARNGSLTICT